MEKNGEGAEQMIKDPGYYRDLLNQILQEEEDIPDPPTRKELYLNKFYRSMREKKLYKFLWWPATSYKDYGVWMRTDLGINYIEGNGWFENNSIINFNGVITVQLDSDDYYFLGRGTSKQGRLRAEKNIRMHLKEACLKAYGLDEDFTLALSWPSRGNVIFSCAKFSMFLTDQFEPLIHLFRGGFSNNEMDNIVNDYFTKEHTR
jgi:hypothetical protein